VTRFATKTKIYSLFKLLQSPLLNNTKIVTIRQLLVLIFGILSLSLVISPYLTQYTIIQFIKELFKDYILASLQYTP
jgi:hypothetical protein